MFKELRIKNKYFTLLGHAYLTDTPKGWILIGESSSKKRMSEFNNLLATEFMNLGFSCLLVDLLTEKEDQNYSNQMDYFLLSKRMQFIMRWLRSDLIFNDEPIVVYSFGNNCVFSIEASTDLSLPVEALVVHDGNPTLAGIHWLNKITCPVLELIEEGGVELVMQNKLAQSEIVRSDLYFLNLTHATNDNLLRVKKICSCIEGWIQEKVFLGSNLGDQL